jgi:dihydropyrimidinase
MECHGVPEFVIVNGRVCVDDEELKAVHGFGRFVPTPAYPPYVYDQVTEREQQRRPQGVTRGPGDDDYAPEVRATRVAVKQTVSMAAPATPNGDSITHGPTASGGRNMQDTTFSIAGEYPAAGQDAADDSDDVARMCGILFLTRPDRPPARVLHSAG